MKPNFDAEKDNEMNQPLALQPPKFSLRTLLLSVACLAILFSLMAKISAVASLGLILTIALAAAHIVATSLGSRLRGIANHNSRLESQEEYSGVKTESAPRPNIPPSSLCNRNPLPKSVRLTTLLCSMIGGILGVALLGFLPNTPANPAGLVFGSISFSVLGGFLGFIAASFFEIVREALYDASERLSK